mmetsp:Transcript_44885/g.71304  ORF Transcript_44885/g.71304 Transcript_44885/m.71304 type:complete len:201 (+) Transcript_44885:678-1280(+)
MMKQTASSMPSNMISRLDGTTKCGSVLFSSPSSLPFLLFRMISRSSQPMTPRVASTVKKTRTSRSSCTKLCTESIRCILVTEMKGLARRRNFHGRGGKRTAARQFTVPLLHRKSCRDCSKRVQLALAVIYAVDCSGAEALNLGATATSQTGSVAQLEFSFKVQRSKKSKRCARSLGISNRVGNGGSVTLFASGQGGASST